MDDDENVGYPMQKSNRMTNLSGITDDESGVACSSTSSSSLTCSFTDFAQRNREMVRNKISLRCEFCKFPFSRLEYAHDTCSPECALALAASDEGIFDAVYANLQSTFSTGKRTYCPVPAMRKDDSIESRDEYMVRCTHHCYQSATSFEASVRLRALDYATSENLSRK